MCILSSLWSQLSSKSRNELTEIISKQTLRSVYIPAPDVKTRFAWPNPKQAAYQWGQIHLSVDGGDNIFALLHCLFKLVLHQAKVKKLFRVFLCLLSTLTYFRASGSQEKCLNAVIEPTTSHS